MQAVTEIMTIMTVSRARKISVLWMEDRLDKNFLMDRFHQGVHAGMLVADAVGQGLATVEVRRFWSDEFKATAVEQASQPGVNVSAVPRVGRHVDEAHLQRVIQVVRSA
jgi:hypothetical protein